MKMCIEKLVALFDKGLEIHAAIEQKDVKPIFPVAEKWKELQEKSIGLLEDMRDDDEE